MKNRKIKKLLLLLCVCVLGLVVTGCSEAITTDVKITSAKKANLTLGVGMDDELLEAYAAMSDLTTDELISELKAQGMDYSQKKMNGVKYHMFSATEKKLSFSKIEGYLEDSGFLDVCLTKDFFYATFDPSSLDDDSTTSAIGEVIIQSAKIAASDDYSDYDISYFVQSTVTFKSKVKATNGKRSNGSKKVTWSAGDTDNVSTFYASTTKVKKAAKATSVKKGKTYALGKTIKVKNSKSVAKMTLDGETIKNGYKVTTTGKHTLKIWSKNGKLKTVTFKIK